MLRHHYALLLNDRWDREIIIRIRNSRALRPNFFFPFYISSLAPRLLTLLGVEEIEAIIALPFCGYRFFFIGAK